MKTLKLAVLLLIVPLASHAQTLTGLWVGSVSNDSNTIRKDQSFEIVLTQYKDKVFGYSRSTFIVNDSLYYIVKRVKGTIAGDICEVKDDDVVSHNFPHKPDKGVKMISTFRFDQQDSVWRMDGNWKTNQTKKFYSLSGKMDLETEPDLERSKIIPHLEELKMTEDVAVYQEAKKEKEKLVAKQAAAESRKELIIKPEKPQNTVVKDIKKDELIKAVAKQENIAHMQLPVENKTNTVVSTPSQQNEASNLSKELKKETASPPLVIESKKEVSVPARSEPLVVKKQTTGETPKQQAVLKEEKQAIIAVKEVKKEPKLPVKQEPRQIETAAVIKAAEQSKEVAPIVKTETKKVEPVAVVAEVKEKPQTRTNLPEVKPVIPQAATFVAERKVLAQQVVFFKSDSLQLSLYDNGEVDGDTVSVLLNGELIIAKQGLKVSAIKKTIYVPAGKMDSLTLVLYAENLGKYPPNTGLLVVHDGDDTYQVRFSADLQQNAAVIFRRKRN